MGSDNLQSPDNLQSVYGNTTRKHHSQAIRDVIASRLERRIKEIIDETDRNPQGARAVLKWLESDLACFATCVDVYSRLDIRLPEDALLEQINQILSGLYRSSKMVLVSGQKCNQALASDFVCLAFSDYTLSKIDSRQFESRFQEVAELVRESVRTIKSIDWSDKANGP